MHARRPTFGANSGQWSVASGQDAQADSSSSYPTPNPQPPAPSRVPRGVTLLELLIVMTIMLMVTAAAIPVMMPALTNRRMREASRLTSSFISGARARAIETGRPAGVMLERFNGLPMAMQLSYVEVPAPYAGDTLDAKVPVTNGEITGISGSGWMNSIRYGDSVKLNYKGPIYTLASVQTTSTPNPDPLAGTVVTAPSGTSHWYLLIPSLEPFTDTNANGVWDNTPTPEPFTDLNSNGVCDILTLATNLPPAFTTGVPFQIIRQPVRSSATPLQLPEGTVIDLVQSGMTTSFFPVTLNPVILFSANGSVERVTRNATGVMMPPSGPIFLLTGRRDLMADVTTSGGDENLWDPKAVPENAYLSNFWVTIAHQTGQVSVAENARTTSFTDITAARVFAQTPQSAGGR